MESFYTEECRAKRGQEPIIGYCIDSSLTKRIVIFPTCLRFSRFHQRQTVLHEMAHALAPGDAHGDNFLDVCGRIMPRAMYFNEVMTQKAKATGVTA